MLVDKLELMIGLVAVVVREEVQLMELVELVVTKQMAETALVMALVVVVLDLEIGLTLIIGLVV